MDLHKGRDWLYDQQDYTPTYIIGVVGRQTHDSGIGVKYILHYREDSVLWKLNGIKLAGTEHECAVAQFKAIDYREFTMVNQNLVSYLNMINLLTVVYLVDRNQQWNTNLHYSCKKYRL